MMLKNGGGTIVEVTITYWPPSVRASETQHAIVSVRSRAGVEIARHETHRCPSRAKAEAAVAALLLKRRYSSIEPPSCATRRPVVPQD